MHYHLHFLSAPCTALPSKDDLSTTAVESEQQLRNLVNTANTYSKFTKWLNANVRLAERARYTTVYEAVHAAGVLGTDIASFLQTVNDANASNNDENECEFDVRTFCVIALLQSRQCFWHCTPPAGWCESALARVRSSPWIMQCRRGQCAHIFCAAPVASNNSSRWCLCHAYGYIRMEVSIDRCCVGCVRAYS